MLVAVATVLLQGKQSFDGGLMRAGVRGFVAQVEGEEMAIGIEVLELEGLQVAGTAGEPEGVDDFADDFVLGRGHGDELLIEGEAEAFVIVGVLVREKEHGGGGQGGEAVLKGVP